VFMVKQKNAAKNSSSSKPEYEVLNSAGQTEYGFPCFIEPYSIVPEITELRVVDDLGEPYVQGVPGYFISGSLGSQSAQWPEPPHLAFANLLADKPEAAEAFTKRYGILSRHYVDREDPDQNKFTIDSASFLVWRDNLRVAWQGDSVGIIDFEAQVEQGFDTDVVVAWRYVQLRPKDLWASICFLFLWDLKAGKLGFCENPDCPAPYFRKKRTTQKFCEAGPCVAYAQRQYSLDWWNRVGKKRRDKKAKTTQHKRSKP
jgi:hypothetical protein